MKHGLAAQSNNAGRAESMRRYWRILNHIASHGIPLNDARTEAKVWLNGRKCVYCGLDEARFAALSRAKAALSKAEGK